MKKKGLYIVHLSVHGLVRGDKIELGVDVDTGGQVKYVVELCKELGRHPEVSQVHLVTRLIRDLKVSPDYSQCVEALGGKSFIVRLPFGPPGYLPKEELWPWLDELEAACCKLFSSMGRKPDLLHAHYADAGVVAASLAGRLGVPWIFTGHSLGRVKLERLIKAGEAREEVDRRYKIFHRIRAEETALASASAVVSSTRQEDANQYSLYENYNAYKMRVIPPGIDYQDFRNVKKDVGLLLRRFLENPKKPMVLAVARSDPKKNLDGLVEAFSNNNWLRENTNLVILSGKRHRITELADGARKIWESIFRAVDDGNLYSMCAYPKSHEPSDVRAVMAAAKQSGGVLVNPAVTEPFGLSLVEAAALGLPAVATENGGPSEIFENCHHGVVVDTLDLTTLGKTIESLIKDRQRWKLLSSSGYSRVKQFYSWESHISKYTNVIGELLHKKLIENISFQFSDPNLSKLVTAKPLKYRKMHEYNDFSEETENKSN